MDLFNVVLPPVSTPSFASFVGAKSASILLTTPLVEWRDGLI